MTRSEERRGSAWLSDHKTVVALHVVATTWIFFRGTYALGPYAGGFLHEFPGAMDVRALLLTPLVLPLWLLVAVTLRAITGREGSMLHLAVDALTAPLAYVVVRTLPLG